MPDEPNAIAPALTSDEWKAKRIDRPGTLSGQRYCGQYGMTAEIERSGGATFLNTLEGSWRDPANLTALMALANAALPDDDPRKITREDVRELMNCAKIVSEHYGPLTPDDPKLLGLAAKLAALLPPER